MRFRVAGALVCALAFTVTACTPPATSTSWQPTPIERLAANAGDHAAIDDMIVHLWGDEAWCMERIITRESGYVAQVVNFEDVDGSNAMGLTQMLLPMHASSYTDIGLDPARWGDAWTNLRAARHLYDTAGGFTPWRPVPC